MTAPPLDDATAAREAVAARRIERWGTAGLTVAAAAALAATFRLAALAPSAVLAVPGVVVAAVCLVVILRSPLASVGTAILLSLALAGIADDYPAGKVLFGGYVVLYIALWYGRAWASGQRIIRSGADAGMALLLVLGVIGGTALGVLFQNPAESMAGNIQALLPLFLYFPVKEACVRERLGLHVVAGCVLALGVAAAAQNAFNTSRALSSATEIWQIVDVRVAYGEMALTASMILSVALLFAHRGSWLGRASLVGLFGILTAGMILTKSRGFWVAVLLGLGVFAIILQDRDRRRMLTMAATGGMAFIGLALLVAGQYAVLIATGIAKRFLTISTAGSADPSLINRFTESAAAWARIKESPILGHGWGVEYSYYSIIAEGTMRWAYVHNGYLGIWLKIGLWGLGLVLWVWVGAISAGARAARDQRQPALARGLGGAAAATLVAFLLVANTSPPLENADQVMVLLVVWALAQGVAQRAFVQRA